MIRKCLSRRVTFVVLAALILELIPVAPARAQSSAVITLSAATTPTTGQAGVHIVSVLGSGFPAGAIDPAAVTIRLAPVPPAVGPSAQTRASTLTTVVGSSRRASFLIPSSLVVTNPTSYQVTLDGVTAAGTPFQSGNASLLFLNPPAVILSATPNGAFQGETTAVALVTQYTNFVQGITQASFGPGIRVGGAAAGAFGPVTVISAAQAQAQVVIDAGASLGPRTVQIKTGVQTASQAGLFSVLGPTVVSLEPAQLTIAAGGSGSLTVRIQNADPSRATHVAMTSGDSAVAGVPAEVVVPAGATNGLVPIAGGVAGGPTQITASLNGSSASAEVTVREQPPAPSINEPLVDGALVVGGTGVANALVDVQVNAAAAGFGIVAANGQFAVDVPALHAGEIVTATQTVGGLTSALSAPVTVRARPPAPTVTAPIFEGSLQVSGTGVANASVDVFVNGAPVATGVADPAGAFTIPVPALVAGQQVTATQTVAGVTSIPSAAVTVISVPPAPTVTGPLVEGALSVSGTGIAGATVEVFVANASVGTAIVGGTNSWSLLLSAALVAGQPVKARQTVGGITSDFSADVVVVARPPKPTITCTAGRGRHQHLRYRRRQRLGPCIPQFQPRRHDVGWRRRHVDARARYGPRGRSDRDGGPDRWRDSERSVGSGRCRRSLAGACRQRAAGRGLDHRRRNRHSAARHSSCSSPSPPPALRPSPPQAHGPCCSERRWLPARPSRPVRRLRELSATCRRRSSCSRVRQLQR